MGFRAERRGGYQVRRARRLRRRRGVEFHAEFHAEFPAEFPAELSIQRMKTIQSNR